MNRTEAERLTMELFKIRFKDDLDYNMSIKKYAERYFNEWVSRIQDERAFECADRETKQALLDIGLRPMLGQSGTNLPFKIVLNRTFDNIPDAKEVMNTLYDMYGIECVILRVDTQ